MSGFVDGKGGAPEGATLRNIVGGNLLTATAGTNVNLSIDGVTSVHVLSFNPLSILIGTEFGSAGGKLSQGRTIDGATKTKDNK